MVIAMKRHFFLLCCILALVSCSKKQKGVVGEPRVFKIASTTNNWPTASSEAISRTYDVMVAGGDGSRKWTVEFMDGTQGFILEPNYAANQFTVSIPANTGKESLSDYVIVKYSGEMIYLKVTSMSDWFSVAEGDDLGDGRLGYIIKSDGTPENKGEMVNPGGRSIITKRVSGYNGFTPVFTEDSLYFTAQPNTGFEDLEAVFKIYQRGKEDVAEQTYTVNVLQRGLILPEGGVADKSAPGGYYYPLICGIDVAGVNIPVDENKCWNDYCDPDGILKESYSDKIGETAPVNPCPDGWALPTEAQINTLLSEGTTTLKEKEGLFWNLVDGETSIDTYVLWGAGTFTAMSCETRGNSVNSAWRLDVQIKRNETGIFTVPKFKLSSHSREDTFKSKKAILRCIRQSKGTTL